MKLLIVGSSAVWAIENHFYKYLSEIPEVEIDQFSISPYIDSISIFQRIEKRLLSNNNTLYRKINKDLLKFVMLNKPDALIIFKGMEIFPSTLIKISKLGILLTNFNGDHPFLITSRGSGNNNVRKSLGLYQIHFTYILSLVNVIQKKFKIKTVHLPFAFELEEKLYSSLSDEPEIMKVAFIGNPDKIRIKYIKELIKANLPVDVYGNGWNTFSKQIDSPLLLCFDAVYGNDFWEVAKKYRVQLNIFRPHNEGSHNMRSFEMPAVGAIMLAPDSPEHRIFFEADQEVIYYSSKEEMVFKAQELLNLPLEKANRIRIQARNRSIYSGYSYRDRVNIVYKAIINLLS
jgi:spore maturation protein CgeB